MKFATKVIHAGIEPDPATGAIMTPIYQTSTYKQFAPGEKQAFEYARTQNPTRTALQNNVAALENGAAAVCFASGLAAINAICQTLNPGDEIISTNDLYGGSHRLFTKVFGRFGIKSHFVDMTDLRQVEKQITSKTKMIWIETPTNPMLRIIDIEAVCQLAKKHKVWTVVDNTFASPYLQTPLDLGADVVVHSATKYLGGHSDVIHGLVVCKEQAYANELLFVQNAAGAVPGPQDCFLVLRGIKTLHLRVQRACENARAVAQFLRYHAKVDKVYYPGFEDHEGHDIAKRQMKDFGGMVSFSLKIDTYEAALQVLSGTHYFTCAESLGGVESLIGHPATMTHGAIPKAQREAVGITDSLIRLSIGIEDADDLIADLAAALDSVG